MPLSATTVRTAEPRPKGYKLADGGGLYLFVMPTGSKSWRLKYRHQGKERCMTFGLYPDVSISSAREHRELARSVLKSGRDPIIETKRRQIEARASIATTFTVAASAWHEDQQARWSPHQALLVLRALKRDVYPSIGEFPVVDISAPLILHVLRKIEARGAIETAKRVRGYIAAVFDRAIAEGLLTTNPASHVSRALKPNPRGSKQPALTTLTDLTAFQRLVDRSSAGPATKLASRLLALTAVRVGVLRAASWKEISGVDWERPDQPAPHAVWKVSAARMKLGMSDKADTSFDHDVPLPPPAVETLRALHRLTGRGRLLFPGHKSARAAMSDSAISTLYKRMDGGRYKGKHVPHGWRSAFSTIMNEWAMEHGKEGDRLLIDLMLAHKPKGVSGSEFAYMRAKFAARRRVIAETWADMIAAGLDSPMTILDGLPTAPAETSSIAIHQENVRD